MSVGLGAVLGLIYQPGVAQGATGPLGSVVSLLVNAYNFTGADLGVAKNYFVNGAATNPSTTPPGYVPVAAVAPTGFTLPTFNGLPNTTNSVHDLAYGVTDTQPGQKLYGSSRPIQVAPNRYNLFDPTALNGIVTNPSLPAGTPPTPSPTVSCSRCRCRSNTRACSPAPPTTCLVPAFDGAD